MIIANRSTIMEKVLLDHAVKDMSQGKERKIHIVHCYLFEVTNAKVITRVAGKITMQEQVSIEI